MTTEEIWKAHPEWPIDVSNHGRVRRQRDGKLVKLTPSSGGSKEPSRRRGRYLRVGVCIPGPTGSTQKANVHTLVLETFVGPRPEDYEPDHYPDRNGHNNHLWNLAWVTKEVNRQHKRSRKDIDD